jgi:hypothetical protein
MKKRLTLCLAAVLVLIVGWKEIPPWIWACFKQFEPPTC